MSSMSAAGTRPAVIPVSTTLPWLLGALVLGLAIYYVIGIGAGPESMAGSQMAVHEFLHDARHFLGFPCH
jgi:cobalt transporter subunit CbtB